MAITAASIEANGWVLRLVFSGSPGSFASYALDPDGSPGVTLTTAHPGFAPSAGTAVAASLARVIVATKPLRKPVNPASPFNVLVDETDNGDGTVTVRLALSNYIHETEGAVSLSVAAGWRAGEAAASGIAIVNASTFAAALPIFRWSDVPYQRVAGPVTLELVAFSHHPQGLNPVAAVKFTITDGTGVKSAWATAPSTSNRYGDNLRVYSATIDPATATALSAGLLRCDAEIYPWLGAMRSTDTPGTRSMVGLGLAGYGDAATTPFIVGYDPVGTRYGDQVLFVDPVNGTTTPLAAMVKTDLAGARAIAPAARPKDLSVAVQALYLANRALAAGNGQPASTRALDGARIVLAAGVHVPGTVTVTSTPTTIELPLRIEGDPDDPNPRDNVVLQVAATNKRIRVTKVALSNLSVEVDAASLFDTLTFYYTLDNITVRGKAGSEASSTAIGAVAPPNGSFNMSATRVRWWQSGSRMNGNFQRFGLIRASEASRRVEALCTLTHRFIGGGVGGEDIFQTSEESCVGGWASITTAGAGEDLVVFDCDLRYIKGRVWNLNSVPAAVAGTPNPSNRRNAFVNNVCEKMANVGTAPLWSMGEDTSATMSYNLIEGCTFVGERSNCMYSDPAVVTAADTNTLLNQAYGNRVANCSFDWLPTKHDDYNDAQTMTARGSTNGYRPQMTEAWSVTYGVGWEGNVDFARHPSANNFNFEYLGLRSAKLLFGTPAWTLDRSGLSGGTTSGGGDYKPPATSPLVGRALCGSADRDRLGAVRTVPFASGAIDTASTPAATMSPALSLLTVGGAATVIGWAGVLAAVGGGIAVHSGTPVVEFAAALAPDNGSLASAAGTPVVEAFELLLAPAGGVATLSDFGVAVLPDLLFAVPRLVRIEGEVRVQLINAD
ncbi:hypothetical protein KX816_14890 [Sphingosinicellaceae bacterium]|nr:hypothetical protein KX816_14890 [Sphingosinicellaceae bacterium]